MLYQFKGNFRVGTYGYNRVTYYNGRLYYVDLYPWGNETSSFPTNWVTQ